VSSTGQASDDRDGYPRQIAVIRDSKGRYLKGHPGGQGQTDLTKRVTEFRRAVLECTSLEDILKVWAVLYQKALKGEKWAIQQYLDRVLGKDVAALFIQQIIGTEPLVKLIEGLDVKKMEE
jgi:hypothetical protein